MYFFVIEKVQGKGFEPLDRFNKVVSHSYKYSWMSS